MPATARRRGAKATDPVRLTVSFQQSRATWLRERLTSFNLIATWRQVSTPSLTRRHLRMTTRRPKRRPASKWPAGSRGWQLTGLTKMRGAADPELIALADRVLAHFPEHRSELEPHLLPYWGSETVWSWTTAWWCVTSGS